ncbi:hypothetical protein ACIOZL_28925 [Streptomyces sp. NPDC087769]|uniref:hypothetical protein n=2 Tax=Streptomyces TaxID=1883 RepID=UPI003803EF0C
MRSAPMDNARLLHAVVPVVSGRNHRPKKEDTMILLLVLLAFAIVLAIIGAAVEGMQYLLAIAVLLLIADVGYLAVRSALRRRQAG